MRENEFNDLFSDLQEGCNNCVENCTKRPITLDDIDFNLQHDDDFYEIDNDFQPPQSPVSRTEEQIPLAGQEHSDVRPATPVPQHSEPPSGQRPVDSSIAELRRPLEPLPTQQTHDGDRSQPASETTEGVLEGGVTTPVCSPNISESFPYLTYRRVNIP